MQDSNLSVIIEMILNPPLRSWYARIWYVSFTLTLLRGRGASSLSADEPHALTRPQTSSEVAIICAVMRMPPLLGVYEEMWMLYTSVDAQWHIYIYIYNLELRGANQ